MSGTNALDSRGSVLSAIANPTVVNPLRAMSDATNAAKGVYDIRQQQANEAAGQAFLNSIDPATGQPNAALLNQNLRSNPATAMAAQQAAQHGIVLDSDTYKLHSTRLSGAMSAMGQLIADNPNGVPQDAAHAAIDKLRQQGLITDAEAPQLKGLFGGDQHANTATILQGMTRNLTGQQNLDAARPPSTITDVGGAKVPITPQSPLSSTPYSGQQTVAPGGAALSMSPGQQAQYQQWLQSEIEVPDPNNPGGTQKATRQQMFERMHVDPRLFYPQSGGPPSAPAAPTPSTPPSTAPPASTPPASTVSSGTPLTVASQADVETQKAGAASGIALMARADQVPTKRANYDTFLADMQKLDTMGPSTDRQNYFNSLSQKWLGVGLLGNATPQQIAAADSIGKVSSLMVADQMQSLGATDARQQLAIGANPHLDLSKLGNEQIIHMLKGNEDAIEAKSRAWKDWTTTHGTGSYSDFQNDLNKHFDLRVFQQKYMGRDEIQNLRKQLESQGQDKKFLANVKYARDHGWID